MGKVARCLDGSPGRTPSQDKITSLLGVGLHESENDPVEWTDMSLPGSNKITRRRSSQTQRCFNSQPTCFDFPALGYNIRLAALHATALLCLGFDGMVTIIVRRGATRFRVSVKEKRSRHQEPEW
eukprot:scaffold2515_cov136-Amphora_coffeaeformis.AAC.2